MSDLLKSAIADAKAVRATALANAKAALEEAFAPKLQSMLATKLQQEVEDDVGEELPEDPASPVDAPVTDEVPVADAPEAAPADVPAAPDMAPAPDLGVGDAPVEAPADMAPEAPAPDFGGGDVPVEPDGDEEIPVDDVDEVLGQGHPDPFDQTGVFTEEKASTNYKKTTKGAKTEDPQGAKKEWSSGPGKADKKGTTGSLTSKGGTQKASPDYKKTTSGAKTEDPQGASKELACGPGKADKSGTGKTLEENDISDETLDEILKELESEVSDVGNDYAAVAAPAPVQQPAMEEEIDLSSLLESDDNDADDKKEVEEGKLPPWLKKGGKKDDEDDKDEDEGNEKEEVVKENNSLKQELQEYRSAVQYLRDRINEVNLLNAKLLYTNKLLKQTQLTKEQKLKVIESFDLTKSVREAKLIYSTLAESLNFGAKKTTVPAQAARKSAMVKTITEGLASKAVASTKPTKPVLTEGAEMANRFMKLAGIKKK